MQVVEWVMQTYGMLVRLSPQEEAEARAQVSRFLKDKKGDEHSLAVGAMKFLRGDGPFRKRPG